MPNTSRSAKRTLPTVFLPVAQAPSFHSESFALLTPLPQAAIAKAIQSAIACLNGAIPIEVHLLAEQVEASMTRERVLAVLSAFFMYLLSCWRWLACTVLSTISSRSGAPSSAFASRSGQRQNRFSGSLCLTSWRFLRLVLPRALDSRLRLLNFSALRQASL
jgi:hypothetical protein